MGWHIVEKIVKYVIHFEKVIVGNISPFIQLFLMLLLFWSKNRLTKWSNSRDESIFCMLIGKNQNWSIKELPNIWISKKIGDDINRLRWNQGWGVGAWSHGAVTFWWSRSRSWSQAFHNRWSWSRSWSYQKFSGSRLQLLNISFFVFQIYNFFLIALQMIKSFLFSL